MQDDLCVVELHRGARGYGFSIRGGREFDNMPLFVLRIAETGAASLDGRLKVSSADSPPVLFTIRQSPGGK